MKNIKSIFMIIAILIVGSISMIKTIKYFSTSTYARYVAKGAAATPVDIAVPVVRDTLNTTFSIPLSSMIPGDIKGTTGDSDYSFSVMNFEDIKVNEATFNYTIEVSKTNYLPITLKLQKLNNDSEFEDITLNNGVSPSYILPHTTFVTHIYRLVIEWNGVYDTYSYSDLLDIITITINATQKIS